MAEQNIYDMDRLRGVPLADKYVESMLDNVKGFLFDEEKLVAGDILGIEFPKTFIVLIATGVLIVILGEAIGHLTEFWKVNLALKILGGLLIVVGILIFIFGEKVISAVFITNARLMKVLYRTRSKILEIVDMPYNFLLNIVIRRMPNGRCMLELHCGYKRFGGIVEGFISLHEEFCSLLINASRKFLMGESV